MSLLALLDYASVAVFALTGALVASRAQLDIVGFAFVASLTAVGGGTLRDVLLDRNPIFWVAEPSFIAVAVGAKECSGLSFARQRLAQGGIGGGSLEDVMRTRRGKRTITEQHR